MTYIHTVSWLVLAPVYLLSLSMRGEERMRVLSALVLLLSVGMTGGEAMELSFRREDFPEDFVFGSGTSAYQVEGAAAEDGRTPSIWDTFAHAGKAVGEVTGDVAADGYHKYKEDVKLMEDTGLEAYRFSISWSRLLPDGRGYVNPKGLQYYNNLINELISHGIQPHITLFHYDLPQVLEDEYGGWLSPMIVDDFTAYADVCFKEFGDRVFYWTTLNEPNIFALGGYDTGILPPQRCSYPFGTDCSDGNSILEPYIVAHNCLLAHASATTLYRRKYQAKQLGFIGLNIFAYWFRPLTNSAEDITATQRANDFYTGWFMDPLVFGDYPATMKKYAGMKIPSLSHYQTKQVMGSFDFIGLNHYTTLLVEDDSNNEAADKRDFLADSSVKFTTKSVGKQLGPFPVAPDGLQGILEYFKQVYGNPPIYIHENGYPLTHNGSLNDTPRVEYLSSYMGNLLLAIRNGSSTRGYFTWSFLDCFELLQGYRSSYGLYYVDFGDKDLKRHPKLSAHWYSNFLKGHSSVVTMDTTSSRFYLQ